MLEKIGKHTGILKTLFCGYPVLPKVFAQENYFNNNEEIPETSRDPTDWIFNLILEVNYCSFCMLWLNRSRPTLKVLNP